MREVYVMGHTRYYFRYKIGISYNSKKRQKSISETMKGDAYIIFRAKFYFAEMIEAMMHWIYRPFNARMTGNGKTEWFWLIVPVSPILILSSIWLIQRAFIWFVLIGFVYFLISL